MLSSIFQRDVIGFTDDILKYTHADVIHNLFENFFGYFCDIIKFSNKCPSNHIRLFMGI